MTTEILDDIDQKLFGYVAEWACSRRYYSILRGLQEHHGSAKFTVKTERWMAYNLWRIVSKRELDKYVDAIEILQQLHSKWPKLITFEEYRRILLEMKTKAILNLLSSCSDDLKIIDMTCKMLPRKQEDREDLSDEEAQALHKEQLLIRHNIICMISESELRKDFSEHFRNVMKDCQEKLPLEQLVEQYTDKINSELGECALIEKLCDIKGDGEAENYDQSINAIVKGPLTSVAIASESSSTATFITTPNDRKSNEVLSKRQLLTNKSASIGNSRTSSVYATFSIDDKSSTLTFEDDRLDMLQATDLTSVFMPTTENKDVVASSVTDENVACLQDLLACSSTYSEMEGSKAIGKAMITMATLSKDLSGNSKDISIVKTDVAKHVKADTTIPLNLPLKSNNNIIVKKESTSTKQPPIYIIDSSSGNSCNNDKRDTRISDSLEVIEQPITRTTTSDNRAKSTRSKRKSKSVQNEDSRADLIASNINMISKVKSRSNQHRQDSPDYENMQVVGYRMLESGSYECVLIGKDKRRCSVIFEQCNVEIAKQSF
ncbi:hypothetical protein TrispH2_005353 [Trichoplax sp. H2]|nr:hypothetical protein TrispH2_005353 [Trichoplax sp. H2]|eukprot:RDD43058.1 hypothetical protein TrispH2_005353 [Trichoplax sp. H2]